MKIKKIMLSLPVLGILCVSNLNVYAANDNNDTAQNEYNNVIDYNTHTRLEGEISDIQQNRFVLATEGQSYTVTFSSSTLFVKEREVVDYSELVEGDRVVVVYEDSLIAPAIYPPQVNAIGILIEGYNHYNLYVGKFTITNDGTSLVSDNNGLRLPINDDDRIVYDTEGNETDYALRDLDNAILAVVYGAATFSLPPIPLGPTVYLLSHGTDNEVDVNNTNDTDGNQIVTLTPELPNVVVPSTTSSNLLDQIPFWAGGNLGGTNTIRNQRQYQNINNGTSLNNIQEVIEDIIDDSYYTGLEIIIDIDEVIIVKD